jgi:hypothetical protein
MSPSEPRRASKPKKLVFESLPNFIDLLASWSLKNAQLLHEMDTPPSRSVA